MNHNITRTVNRTAAGILSAAVGVGVWGWIADGRIVERLVRSTSNPNKSPNVPVAGSRDTGRRSSEEPLIASEIWSRSLQSGFQTKSSSPVPEPMTSPVVPSSKVVAPQRKASPDVGLRLVGTVIEKGRSIAIAIDSAGKLDFCREGDSLQLEPEGVLVEFVSDNSVRVLFKGQATTWLMGQSLRFELEEDIALEGPAPTESRNKPKMSLNEELELINSIQPSIPL